MKKRILLLIETSRGYGRGVVEGVARFAQELNEWSIFFEDSGLDGIKAFDHNPLLKSNWDGIIVRSPTLAIAKKIQATRIPSVELLTASDPNRIFPDVITDYVKVSHLAAGHLIECQLKNFAYFTIVDTKWSNFRGDEFSKALSQEGFSCHFFPVEKSQTSTYPHSLQHWDLNFQDRLIRWLQRLPKPLGLFVATDSYAIYILQACMIGGISIPDEIAVLSCDNDLLICRTVFPPLSSIDHNTQAVGYQAASLLNQKINKKKTPLQTIFVPPGNVVKRETTGIVACDDEYLFRALTFVRNNLSKSITITNIANAACVTRKTLERHFKEKLGRTPLDEVLRLRMEKAKLLLRETSLSVEMVAQQVGYLAFEYFIRVFKRTYKMTPHQYRQSFQFSDYFSGDELFSATPLGEDE